MINDGVPLPVIQKLSDCQEEQLRRLYPDGTNWLLPSPPARGAPGMDRGASTSPRVP